MTPCQYPSTECEVLMLDVMPIGLVLADRRFGARPPRDGPRHPATEPPRRRLHRPCRPGDRGGPRRAARGSDRRTSDGLPSHSSRLSWRSSAGPRCWGFPGHWRECSGSACGAGSLPSATAFSRLRRRSWRTAGPLESSPTVGTRRSRAPPSTWPRCGRCTPPDPAWGVLRDDLADACQARIEAASARRAAPLRRLRGERATRSKSVRATVSV